jgi:hypothetical protein
MKLRHCALLLVTHRAAELNAKYPHVYASPKPAVWTRDLYLRPRLRTTPQAAPSSAATLIIVPVLHYYAPWIQAIGHATCMAFDRTTRTATFFDSSNCTPIPEAFIRRIVKATCGDTVHTIDRRVDMVQGRGRKNCVAWMVWAMGAFAARGAKLGRALRQAVDDLEEAYRRRIVVRTADGHTLLGIDCDPLVVVGHGFHRLRPNYEFVYYRGLQTVQVWH